MNVSNWSIVAAVGLLAVASPATGQDRWTVELRGGAAFPTEDIGADALGTGVSLEATLGYRLHPGLAGYAGWGWAHFNPETSFAGADIDFEETGYVFGLRFERPLGDDAPVAAWLRLGGTVAHLELENAEGDVVADTDHGLGFDAGLGLALDLGGSWSITPGVRYRSLSRDVGIGAVSTEVDLQYLAVEIGAALSF